MKPVSREGYKFRQDISIPCYQTDVKCQLRPAAFMDLAQEIAYWAAHELGFGYDTLHIHHTAWVLSRMHIHFVKPVAWRDQVTLYTWHKGSSGLFYLRDFVLLNPAGEQSVVCTSSWVVINEETRRLVRPEDLAHFMTVDYEVDDAIAEPAPKVVMPRDARSEPGMTNTEPGMTNREAECVAEHRVAFSDVDLIGHTNNARYVVWAMDCLPPAQTEQPLKDLYINFNKETKADELVQLYRLQDGTSWYVEGRVDGKSCFVVKLEY